MYDIKESSSRPDLTELDKAHTLIIKKNESDSKACVHEG